MIKQEQLNLISQIIDSIYQMVHKLEEAQKNNDTRTLELAKREIFEFQKRLSAELEETGGENGIPAVSRQS